MKFLDDIVSAFHSGRGQHRRERRTRSHRRRREFRPNPWPKCNGDAGGCWHRVPGAAIHPVCKRAAGPPKYPALREAYRTHPYPCCPGQFDCCDVCTDRVDACDQCTLCKNCCEGHNDKKGES